MDENKIKSQLIGAAIPTVEDHPLHMLDNQANPRKYQVGAMTQKPIRTYESDVAEALGKKNASVINIAVAQSEKKVNDNKIIEKQALQEKAAQIKYTEVVQKKPIEKPVEETLEIQDLEMDTPIDILKEKPLQPVENKVIEKKQPIATGIQAKNIQPNITTGRIQVEAQKSSSHIGKKIFLTLISLILISAGSMGGYYLYSKSSLAVPSFTQPKTKIPSIVSSDAQKISIAPSLQKDKLLAFFSEEFKTNVEGEGKIVEFVPMQITGSSTEKITSSEFIKIAGFGMTDSLKRSLTDKWMVGTYSKTDQPLPFIILTTDFFQNAFSGMLRWETTMPDDLAQILNYKEKALATTDTTATTTRISSLYGIKGKFKDKVIMNRDIREFISDHGEILFLYTFLDKDTLLITTSEEVIPVLLDRIEKQTYIR